MRLFLSGFIFLWLLFVFAFYSYIAAKSKAFHRLAVAFRWNAY